MSVFRDELFGPVAAVIKATDPEHALELANDIAYGLSSAVLTNDLQFAMKFALELAAGMVTTSLRKSPDRSSRGRSGTASRLLRRSPE